MRVEYETRRAFKILTVSASDGAAVSQQRRYVMGIAKVLSMVKQRNEDLLLNKAIAN